MFKQSIIQVILFYYLAQISFAVNEYQCSSNSYLSDGHRKLKKLYSRNERPITILGVPFAKGQRLSGTELAPDLFRKQNIVSQIKRLGYESVVDYGDLKITNSPKDRTTKTRNNFTEIHNQFTLSETNLLIKEKVEELLNKGQTVVILGGDHSLTAGSILGNANVSQNICVLYIDAHGDLNNCESSTSGNLHGMPLSFVIKGMERLHKNFKSCPAMKVIKPLVSAMDVVLIASRDLDDLELDIINEFNIRHYSMRDIDEIGIKAMADQILNTVCKSKSRIHVSFDIDSLDVVYAPNTGTTVYGGLTVREALLLAELISNTNKVNVIEMYEVNPSVGSKDMSHTTVNIAMNIILSFLGKSREVLWGHPWEGGWGERKDQH